MGVENNISNEWSESTLGDLITHKKGFAFKSKDYSKNGRKIVKVKDFTSNSIDDTECDFISEELAESFSDYELKHKDVVIQTVGSWPSNPASIVGKVVRVPQKVEGALLNQNAVKLISTKNVDNDFLFYSLIYKRFKSHLISRAQGSANQASITLKDIFDYELNLPPLPEQKAIAKVLTAFDDKIELLQAQNKTLETMAQTIFKEWFGKYQIGDELPEGWKEGKLGYLDFITFGDGNYSSKYPKQSDFIDNGIPFISNKDIKNGIIQPNGLRYISPELHSTLTKGHLEKWDIIMSTRANIGDIALVSSAFSGANINAQLIFIRSTRKEFYTPYLLQLFSSKLFRKTVENYSSGSAQSQLPMHALREIPILIPDEKTLLNFAQLWNKLTSKKEINQNQIQSLTKTRDTLLPKLMSGQVRVNNIKQTADA